MWETLGTRATWVKQKELYNGEMTRKEPPLAYGFRFSQMQDNKQNRVKWLFCSCSKRRGLVCLQIRQKPPRRPVPPGLHASQRLLAPGALQHIPCPMPFAIANRQLTKTGRITSGFISFIYFESCRVETT